MTLIVSCSLVSVLAGAAEDEAAAPTTPAGAASRAASSSASSPVGGGRSVSGAWGCRDLMGLMTAKAASLLAPELLLRFGGGCRLRGELGVLLMHASELQQ